jgi:hypothetical protein
MIATSGGGITSLFQKRAQLNVALEVLSLEGEEGRVDTFDDDAGDQARWHHPARGGGTHHNAQRGECHAREKRVDRSTHHHCTQAALHVSKHAAISLLSIIKRRIPPD